MTKKKTSRKKRQGDVTFADTSEEEIDDSSSQGKCCPHVSKAVNIGKIKKFLKTVTNLHKCMGCIDKSDDALDEDSEVWMCLQCGYCGCGRTSPNKHAIQHNKTLHSDCHSVVLGISSGFLWCYDCDSEIQKSSANLKQCIDFIMKFTPKEENVIIQSTIKEEPAHITKENSHAFTKDHSSKQDVSSKEPKTTKTNIKKNTSTATKAQVKGLKNLGNTCFFNAVMQNLSQTPLLEQELSLSSNVEHLWEVPHLVLNNGGEIVEDEEKKLKISLPKQLILSQSLMHFLKQMTSFTGTKVEAVNPSSLFGEISKKSPQFRHFQQQDSHELLRQLLDGVRQEEIKRQKKSILRAFKLENASPENVTEDLKKYVKAYGSYASHTLVEKVFGGLLISTVLCEECKMSSQVFEPFMDLSLPVFEEKSTRSKFDMDSDESTSNEYMLTKKKNEPTKLTKFQEKKLKQQAKNAKKKNKLSRFEKQGIVISNEEPKNTSSPENPTVPQDEDSKENLQNGEKSDSNENKGNDKNEDPESNDTNQHDEEIPPSNKPCHVEISESEDTPIENGLLPDDDKDTEAEDLSVSAFAKYDRFVITQDAEDRIPNGQDTGDHLENPAALEDRLQMLCSQIKDIRIRRDSDRQESILDSSRSISDCEDQKGHTSHESFTEDNNVADNGDNWSHSLSEHHTKEWIMRSLTTLKPRNQPSPSECSINSCLSHFTKSELLTGSNKFRCENCTKAKKRKTNSKNDVVYTNASKQLLIFSPPAILTLHLKRFQQIGLSLRKVNRFVDFPLKLDLAPYCSSASLILPHMTAVKDEIIYSLYGVVEHSGRLTSGHYTAFVKVSQKITNESFMNNWPLGQCDLEQMLQKFSKVNTSSASENVDGPNCDEDGVWFYISDTHVKEVKESEVLNCQAYILFYQRIK